MMSLNKNECRKFSPNIFNKSKCQNCFACKDSHSAEALDNNRVSRKVSKCGYLFVAPDWDFTNPINRTKRWQRRWFVLFDDGELTYSVDEHPDTIPQALIDMTKVLEVSNAEELTGNQFAIAIIAPEKVHFVKGTSREESKWWYDVLSIFPRSIKNTRHKRNSTFPGGKASSVVDRPVEIQSSEPANNLDNKSDDVTTDGNIVNVKNRKNSHGLSHTPVQSKSLSLQSTNQTRERRLIKRGGPNPRSLSDGVNLMIPKEEKRKEINSNTDTYIVTVTDSNKNETGKIKTNSEISNKLTTNPSTSRLESIRSTQQDQHLSIPRLINAKEKSVSKNHTVFTHEADNFHLDHETNGQAQKELLNVRGDPDGCGLDTKSIVSASSHPIEHPVSIKKGWLLRHDGNDEWTKVWCVLNDNAIEYYDDSSDEVTGSSTAIVSLADICSIRKHHVVQQNGFQLEMQNGDTHTLSAITPSIRATWLNAVRSAVGFPCDDSTVEPLSSLGEKIEKESSSITDATTDIRPDSQHTSLDVPSSPRSGLSSDDEFKTASEASGRTEDYFEWADEDVDQSSTSRALPPSPPLNRTPISRVKERARTRSTVRGSQSDKNDGCKKSGSLSQSGCKEDASKDDLSGSDRETYSTPKMQRRSNNCRRRKNSSGTKSDIPESMMVELLESEVDSLKLQLTRCQQEILDLQQNNRLEVKSHEEETNPWQQKNVNKTREKENEIKANAIQDMQNWQKKYAELYSHYQNLRKKNELLEQTSGLNEREQHLFNACHRAEEKYRTEKIKWENESKVLDDECNRLVCNQQKTISQLEDRLRRSETKMMSLITEIEELEATIKKERTEKNGDLSSQDFEEGNCEMGLVELHRKLENTQKQVKSLKKELEIAEKSSDQYEMECINIRQSIGMNEEEHKSQMKLMVQRIEDLTTKLSTAEKQNRQIKQKFARLENKEQKRTRSLKGKELEMNKGEEIESKSASAEKITEKITEKKPTINEENGDTNSVQLLVRINALESNVEKATEKLLELKKGNKSEDDDELSSQDVCDSASLLSEVSRKKMADVDGESKSTIRRSLSAIQQIISFFKEKETTLAQLGLLNKQTQTKINIEKMIYQASLIGHTGGRLCRPSLNRYEVYKQKRRLYLNMTALEKKIESVESLDVLDEENISNDECDLKTLRSRVEKAMSSYKNINLNSLAVAMIRKATEKCVEKENEGIKVDVLAQKLTELEMKRVVSAVAHLREEEDAICSIIWDCDNSKMRDLIRTRLQKTTGAIVDELQHRFRQLLKTDVMKDSSDNSKSNLDTKLAEFVDIIAQETILVTRIDELNEFESDLIQCESDSESNQMIDDVFQREFELLHCEVDKFASSLVHTPRSKMSESFVDRSLNRKWNVQDVLKSVSDGKPSFFLNSVESRTARRSFRQRGQRSVTMPIFCSLETPETTTKKDCADCERLEEKLKEVKEKEGRNEEDIFKSIEAKTAQIKHLERQLRMAEQKVVAKEEENKQQIAALKEAYEEEAARKNDSSINEEAVRQTYQNEIDQLRGLCEKGLVAMENSHRRIVNELEEKHQRELDQLQAEKEQALAEETQATLAALDAMRKAHETELQREIVKFKQNFLEKMQSSHELDSLQKDQEEEIEAIKEEILSLSEKYSIKCLENASLEERLKPLLKQLTDANSLAFDLTARNKQLRAMLNLNNADLQSEIENSKDEDEIGSCKLKLKESELMERNEEIGDLKRMLRVSRRHEDELADRCHQLDQSLKAERRMRQDEVSSLRDRLEHIILTSNASLEVRNLGRLHVELLNFPLKIPACHENMLSAVASSKTQVDPIISQPKMRRNIFGFKSRELMRSPSCPGLNINNDTVSAALECGGVVTSRKRLFEAGKSYC